MVNRQENTIAEKRKRASGCTMIGFIFLTIFAGMLHPTQAGLNILLKSHLNNEAIRASFVSFGIGSLSLIPFLFYDCKSETIPKFNHLFNALNKNKIEYLLFLNGFLAAFYVTATIYIAPLLGFALYFICVVTGQMIFSSALDWGHHSFKSHIFRLFSISLLLTGVIICEIDSLNDSDKNGYYSILYCLIGVIAGMAGVTRSFMNRRFEYHLQNSYFAANINFIGGALVCFIVAFIQWCLINDKNIFTSETGNGDFTIYNCYIWFGGICGSIYLTIVTIIMPGYVGYVASYICAIFGNLIMSTVYDTFGVFSGTQVDLSTMRILGIILVFIAVLGINLPKLYRQLENERKLEREREEKEKEFEIENEKWPLMGQEAIDSRITPHYGLIQL